MSAKSKKAFAKATFVLWIINQICSTASGICRRFSIIYLFNFECASVLFASEKVNCWTVFRSLETNYNFTWLAHLNVELSTNHCRFESYVWTENAAYGNGLSNGRYEIDVSSGMFVNHSFVDKWPNIYLSYNLPGINA